MELVIVNADYEFYTKAGTEVDWLNDENYAAKYCACCEADDALITARLHGAKVYDLEEGTYYRTVEQVNAALIREYRELKHA